MIKRLLSSLALVLTLVGSVAAGSCQYCTSGCDTVGYCHRTYSHGGCTGAQLRVATPHDECRTNGNPYSACFSAYEDYCYKDYSADCSCTPIVLTGSKTNGYC